MRCNICKKYLPEGEEEDLYGLVLCSDCYLFLISPFRMCNPLETLSSIFFRRHKSTV